MKYTIGFVFGTIVALSLSAFADDRRIIGPATGLGAPFMATGGIDSDGTGHLLKMTADGRVLAKCVEDRQ
jgi:hypothetical protein